MGWSPEQIAGRLRLEGSEHTVCHEIIYRFICRPRLRGEKLYRLLPRAKATRGRRYFKRRREPIPGRRSIHHSPPEVQSRSAFGHWEGNLLQFRTQRGNLLTLCERKTRFTLAPLVKTKTAEETVTTVRTILGSLPQTARQTITFDNGSEFTLHLNLTQSLAIETFSCDPHSPWQRGTIENTNGIIRRDMPRTKQISEYTARDIDDLAWAINSTSRKCLGFKTPAETFLENLNHCT